MLLELAGKLYGAIARTRRRWYARTPSRIRSLAQPVISIGNIRVGGSGKTPVVEYVVRLLLQNGERPAILTRGYARTEPRDGVTVVSDGSRVWESVGAAGDEPLMLARALPTVPILVGPNRYLSGYLAERQFGVTVHVLDDGFQHVELARDIDLVLVDPEDLDDQVIPAGRLREPLSAASFAHALLVPERGDLNAGATAVGRALGVDTTFSVIRSIGAPRSMSTGEQLDPDLAGPVLAIAAIARPQRFFSDVAAAGWHVAETLAFRDHHAFTRRDIARIQTTAKACGASVVLTTQKDAVRLIASDLTGIQVAAVPLMVGIEPAARFGTWLMSRLQQCAARCPHTTHDSVLRVSTQHVTSTSGGATRNMSHSGPDGLHIR